MFARFLTFYEFIFRADGGYAGRYALSVFVFRVQQSGLLERE
jgi:hypothetical protein